MLPIWTEVKWHSNKSCYKTIDETINDYKQKTINDSVCTVHVIYSLSYLTQAKTLKNRQLLHVLSADLVDFIFYAIACLHHTQFLASLLRKLPDSTPCSLDLLERKGFFFDSYLIIFAFDRLHSAQHLLRNVLQCERSSRLDALIRFKKVRQLDLFVLVYPFLGRKSLPDLQQFSIIS